MTLTATLGRTVLNRLKLSNINQVNLVHLKLLCFFFQNSCASASCIKLNDEEYNSLPSGIPTIDLDNIKKPEHKHSFSSTFFSYIDGMWGGSLVTVKHAPEFNQDEFYHFRLRKEINLLR